MLLRAGRLALRALPAPDRDLGRAGRARLLAHAVTVARARHRLRVEALDAGAPARRRRHMRLDERRLVGRARHGRGARQRDAPRRRVVRAAAHEREAAVRERAGVVPRVRRVLVVERRRRRVRARAARLVALPARGGVGQLAVVRAPVPVLEPDQEARTVPPTAELPQAAGAGIGVARAVRDVEPVVPVWKSTSRVDGVGRLKFDFHTE